MSVLTFFLFGKWQAANRLAALGSLSVQGGMVLTRDSTGLEKTGRVENRLSSALPGRRKQLSAPGSHRCVFCPTVNTDSDSS